MILLQIKDINYLLKMDDVWKKRIKCDYFGDIDNDDEAVKNWIKSSVGTCKMGNIEIFDDFGGDIMKLVQKIFIIKWKKCSTMNDGNHLGVDKYIIY